MDTDKLLEELSKQTQILKSIDDSMPYSNDERFEKFEHALEKIQKQLSSINDTLIGIKKNTSETQ